jgi:hypothetical protein
MSAAAHARRSLRPAPHARRRVAGVPAPSCPGWAVTRWSTSARPNRSRPPSTRRRTSTCPSAARPPAPRFPMAMIRSPARDGRRNHLAGRRVCRPVAAARRTVAGPPVHRGAAGQARRPAPVPPTSPTRRPRTSKWQASPRSPTPPSSTGVRRGPRAPVPAKHAPVDPARVCQQESRSVSIAHAGPGPQTVPNAYTFPDDAPRPVPAASATSSTQWSRPIRIDVCSMFARMARYGPAPPGIRSATRMRATGQNGSSRHVLALLNSSSESITKHSSGLLIRGFGVQVPGGAPVLTWPYSSRAIRLCLCGAWMGHARARW